MQRRCRAAPRAHRPAHVHVGRRLGHAGRRHNGHRTARRGPGHCGGFVTTTVRTWAHVWRRLTPRGCRPAPRCFGSRTDLPWTVQMKSPRRFGVGRGRMAAGRHAPGAGRLPWAGSVEPGPGLGHLAGLRHLLLAGPARAWQRLATAGQAGQGLAEAGRGLAWRGRGWPSSGTAQESSISWGFGVFCMVLYLQCEIHKNSWNPFSESKVYRICMDSSLFPGMLKVKYWL